MMDMQSFLKGMAFAEFRTELEELDSEMAREMAVAPDFMLRFPASKAFLVPGRMVGIDLAGTSHEDLLELFRMILKRADFELINGCGEDVEWEGEDDNG